MKGKTRIKVEDVEPKVFSLKEHLSIPVEAKKFELPEETVVQVVEEVEREAPPTFVSLKVKEQELRHVLRAILADEIRKARECGWCGASMTSVEQAFAHLRWHMINQRLDPKLARAAILDVEAQLYRTIETEVSSALPAEERSRIADAIARRRALDAGLDDT